MTARRLTAMAALAAALLTGAGRRADASFDFMTVFDNVTVTGAPAGVTPTVSTIAAGTTVNGFTFTNGGVAVTVGGTTVDLSNEGRLGYFVPGTNTINVGDVNVTSTTSTTTPESFQINYRDSITLVNNGPPGTNATSPPLPFTGTLTFSNISTGTGTVSNAFTSPTSGSVLVGGVRFTGGIDTFAPPNVNGTGGNLGGTVTAAVPEPSSVALVGMGLVGGCGLLARRRMLAARVD